MHINEFKDKVLHINSMIPGDRVDIDKLILSQFMKYYPLCIDIGLSDLNIIKYNNVEMMTYDYIFKLTDKAKKSLSKHYPEALI